MNHRTKSISSEAERSSETGGLATDPVIRAGDIVHHDPTGEDWVVAYVDGEYLAWCGWPEGEARLNDCWLKTSCTDEKHVEILREIARSSGKRARKAQAALAKIVEDLTAK